MSMFAYLHEDIRNHMHGKKLLGLRGKGNVYCCRSQRDFQELQLLPMSLALLMLMSMLLHSGMHHVLKICICMSAEIICVVVWQCTCIRKYATEVIGNLHLTDIRHSLFNWNIHIYVYTYICNDYLLCFRIQYQGVFKEINKSLIIEFIKNKFCGTFFKTLVFSKLKKVYTNRKLSISRSAKIYETFYRTAKYVKYIIFF